MTSKEIFQPLRKRRGRSGEGKKVDGEVDKEVDRGRVRFYKEVEKVG